MVINLIIDKVMTVLPAWRKTQSDTIEWKKNILKLSDWAFSIMEVIRTEFRLMVFIEGEIQPQSAENLDSSKKNISRPNFF